MKRKTAAWMISLALLTGSASLHAAIDDTAMAPRDEALRELYWQGHESLRRADWAEALARFERLEDDLRAREPAAVDAALYWQAYALKQARRDAQARERVDALQREFPDSRWLRDAQALLRRGQATPAQAVDADADLAEAAVEALMSAPADRAAPLLRRVLESDHPPRIKKRALFVLSQLDDDAALATVAEVARGADPALRDEAIHMLGISGEPAALDALEAIYRDSNDPDVRGEVLDAWMIADQHERIVAAAQTETDPGLRRDAVQLLGAMGEGAALQRLFAASAGDVATQRAIVQSLGVADDVDALAGIAGGNADVKVRAEALRAIGIAGDGARLVQLYRGTDMPELRKAARDGLMIAGDADAVMELYRSATDAGEKRDLLRLMTTMDDDRVLDLIEEELQ